MLRQDRPWGIQHGERGQVLLFFVAFFSVVLAFGAFALDQGFWLARHRSLQAAADASARAGGLAQLQNLADVGGCNGAAQEAARAAGENRVDVPNPASCSGTHAMTNFMGGGACDGDEGVLSVTAEVGESQRAFFAGAFGIDGVEASARAVACVGTIQTIGPSDVTDSLPIYIDSDDSGSRSCFSGGEPVFGRECVIVSACEDDWNFDAGDPNPPPRLNLPCNNDDFDAGMFVPSQSGDDCLETGINGENPRESAIWDAIRDGGDYTCQIDTPGNCGQLTCIEIENYPDDRGEHLQVLGAFFDRFQGTSGCQLFEDAFVRVDGDPTETAPNGEDVYVQGCPSGHVGLIVFTGNPSTRVKGFATVYFTGCFRQQDPLQGPQTDVNDPYFRCVDDPTANFDHHYEVRGYLVRTYMPEADRGELGRADIEDSPTTVNPNISLPLNIQTVE